MMSKAETFQQHRSRLFGIAYRMLGQRSDAEDALQDVFLRWHDAEDIEDPEAWLVRVTTRRCIDQLRSLRRAREAYAGPWLPEPLVNELDPHARELELAEDLSLAFLAVLERLTPEERAAFLLREVFDFDYAEVASMLDRSEAACRQLVSRGRRHLREARPRYKVTRATHLGLLKRFVHAARTGDRDELEALFADDATYTGDGGGKIPAGSRVLRGGKRVAKLWHVIGSRFGAQHSYRIADVNGEPGLLRYQDGRVEAAITLVTDGVRIHETLLIRNPEKLAGIALAPVTESCG